MLQSIKDLKFYPVDLNDVRAKCEHCGMYQRPHWTKLLARKLAFYCEYCGYKRIFFWKYIPIKINCKWCNPKGKVLSKELPIKDFFVLGA